jgi:endonuclease-8
MHKVLAGAEVTGFDTGYAQLARVNDDSPLLGRVIDRVESRGKWLLIFFTGDLILLTHMLMSGSWHLYRPGERWKRPKRSMRVVIRTANWEAVGFEVPVAEFHTARSLERHKGVAGLGRDILAEDFRVADGAQALAEYGERNPDDEIGNVLLNQRVLAGLGNVYKSEVCFMAGVHPFRRMKTISRKEIEVMTELSQRYLGHNVQDGVKAGIITYTGLRRTTGSSNPGERLWVYRRRGEECRRCGTLIEMRKQGTGARSTFWCPQCQPIGAGEVSSCV